MIVADTSAWIEFLRDTGHPIVAALEKALQDQEVAVTEVVVMELLAGARSPRHLRELRSRILALPMLKLNGLADYEEAALIYRTCRQSGETIRAMTDCLIAVAALNAGASILHADSDFRAMARHTELQIHPESD